MDEEALFGHLAELMDGIPAMEEKGAALGRARAAALVAQRAHEHAGQQAMLDYVQGQIDAHERARAQAIEAGDAAGEERERAQVLLLGNQRGVRYGAEEGARRALADALAESPFATVEEAQAAVLPDEELAALAAEVEAFQRDYAQTLAACQRIEDAS